MSVATALDAERRLVLRAEDGSLLPLHPTRWHGTTTAEERELLSAVQGPALDVGCGPGRLLETLAQRGVFGLGIDPAPTAVAMSRRRGCTVLQRSVFDRLPAEGRWATVLLLDGNIGIGGQPLRLLARCRQLLRPAGEMMVEVEPPGSGWATHRARLERGRETGAWFGWAVVGADAIPTLAGAAGLRTEAVDGTPAGRWFARLLSPSGRARACA